MLYFFFNLRSWWVRAVEIGAVLSSFLIAAAPSGAITWHPSTIVAAITCCTMYIGLRICVSRRWYERVPGVHPETGPIGIESHFTRSHPISVYTMAISNLSLWMGASTHILWASTAILLFVCYVSVSLISYHLRDKDPLPVNYFSAGIAQNTPKTQQKAA